MTETTAVRNLQSEPRENEKKPFLKPFLHKLNKYKILLLMLLPAVFYFTLFSYIPLGGIVLAFKNYNYRDGIFGSPWTGFENFRFFFISGQAWVVIRNTVLYNVVFITVNTCMQMTTAILLTEIKGKWFKKVTQSVMFLPYFISWVIVGVISYNFFSSYGIINTLRNGIGLDKINFNTTPHYWPFILVFFSMWKNIGYGSVLYLAAIMGIDAEIYEAAEIDGANRWQKIFKITIPSLYPTLTILTLLAVGRIFRGDLEMFYQLIGTNGLLYNYTDVIDTFTFRALISSNDVGMAAATGLFQSVFCFVTILITNTMVKRYDKDYSLF